MNTYQKGDLVRVSGTFTNSAGTAIDPSVVKFSYKNPAGTTTTLTYGTDVALVKDSTGNYHVDVDASLTGPWYCRFFSTGTGQAADESKFLVNSDF